MRAQQRLGDALPLLPGEVGGLLEDDLDARGVLLLELVEEAAVRSSVTLTPEAPSRMASLAWPPVALIIASAARRPCWTKSEPSWGPTSWQPVTPVMLRSTGIIATFLLLAYAMASPRPVELIGEKMIAFAPLSIMPLMSVFSCWTLDCALVVSSFHPLALAVSTCDLVEAMRKGLASFSDWAHPMVSLVKSILPMPRSEPLHIGPYCASTPSGLAVVSSVVPPAARMAAGTPFWAVPSVSATVGAARRCRRRRTRSSGRWSTRRARRRGRRRRPHPRWSGEPRSWWLVLCVECWAAGPPPWWPDRRSTASERSQSSVRLGAVNRIRALLPNRNLVVAADHECARAKAFSDQAAHDEGVDTRGRIPMLGACSR